MFSLPPSFIFLSFTHPHSPTCILRFALGPTEFNQGCLCDQGGKLCTGAQEAQQWSLRSKGKVPLSPSLIHDWLLAAPVQLRPSAQSCYDFMIPMTVPCLAGGISHYLLPLTPFMAAPALFPEPWWGGINILSRTELLSTTHSQYLGQLWVSVFTTVHWLGPAGRFVYGYKHWCLEGNLPLFSKTPGISYLLGPMASSGVGIQLGFRYQMWIPACWAKVIFNQRAIGHRCSGGLIVSCKVVSE